MGYLKDLFDYTKTGLLFGWSWEIAWTGFVKENKMPTWFKPLEVEGLNEKFIDQLDQARGIAGIPFTITSGFRTPDKNQSIPGSVSDSAHLTGLAVDLRVENDHEVFLIISASIKVGITRFGIYTNQDGKPTHVHLDVSVDDNHVAEVIWLKREGQANSPIANA